MKTALHNLFESEIAGDMVSFLGGRGAHAHIIAPAWVKTRVDAGQSPRNRIGKAGWSVNLPEQIKDGAINYVVVAEDAATESKLVADLTRRKGAKAYGLFGHVVPALLCSANGMAAGSPTTALKRYAILCIPRSGSRYLSAVLSNRGVGAPREHIREPLARIISDGRLGFGPAIEGLEKFGQKNHIFGTKLISTFFLRASGNRMSEAIENISWLVSRGYSLVHIERPLNDAVISSYIAYRMRKWHFFGKLDENSKAKLDSLQFEDGAGWDEFTRYRAEKVVMNALVSRFHIPTVAYSDIEKNVNSVVSNLCERIGVALDTLKAGSTAVPVPTKTQSPTYQKFSTRLQALLDRRAADIDASTVAKLKEICGLSEAGAEELLRD